MFRFGYNGVVSEGPVKVEPIVWTVSGLAKAGKCTQVYVRRLCAAGRLDAVKVGGRWLIPDYAARAWLASPRKRGRRPKAKAQADQLALDVEG